VQENSRSYRQRRGLWKGSKPPPTRFGSISIDTPLDALGFQGVEEALHNRVVMAVATTTHARLQVVSLHQTKCVVTAVADEHVPYSDAVAKLA